MNKTEDINNRHFIHLDEVPHCCLYLILIVCVYQGLVGFKF